MKHKTIEIQQKVVSRNCQAVSGYNFLYYLIDFQSCYLNRCGTNSFRQRRQVSHS